MCTVYLVCILIFFELYIVILTYDTLSISQAKLVYGLISLFTRSKSLENAALNLILYLTVYSLLIPLAVAVLHTGRRLSDHPEAVIFYFIIILLLSVKMRLDKGYTECTLFY